MFICVCNAITERQVRDAVATGARSLSDLRRKLGVATACGRCARMALEYLREGSSAGDSFSPYMHAQEIRRSGGYRLAAHA